MSNGDPFGGDGDHTILRPMPGGRRPRGPAAPGGPARPPGPPPAPAAAAPAQIVGMGVNPLVAAATPLFGLVGQLRGSVTHPDVGSLQSHVGQEIQNFEAAARAKGEAPEVVLSARYAICTLLDETVLSTPWGAESSWGNQTLLVRFHNEAWGGEKIFQIMERLLQDPPRNLNMLEFLYICLALGFEGKYRVQQRGREQLAQEQNRLYEAIRVYRGETERELSPRWKGVQDQRPKLARYLPLWVVGAIAAGLLLVVYIGLLFTLNSRSDPVVGQVATLGRDTLPLEARSAPAPTPEITLGTVLREDSLVSTAMADGLVKVVDEPGQSRVTLWGLFPSGEADVSGNAQALLLRVAAGLNQFSGRVLVNGHTDNVPIRTLRFPSNWALSEKRANSVVGVLAREVPESRLSSSGSADTRPLVDNDTPVNRALNRRVEITLVYQAEAI